MENIKGPLIDGFKSGARDFCKLMESASTLRTGDFFSQLQLLIPMVYLGALRLPSPRYCYEEEAKHFVSEDTYAGVHDSVQQKIELFYGITRMSPGTRPSQIELESFRMAEMLTDLYEELKNFISYYEVGIPQAMNDAIWLFKRNFEQVFGLRLIEGLRQLHEMIYDKLGDGSRTIMQDDFDQVADDQKPWFTDEQEEVYGDDD